jgi:hypothetical protein
VFGSGGIFVGCSVPSGMTCTIEKVLPSGLTTALLLTAPPWPSA